MEENYDEGINKPKKQYVVKEGEPRIYEGHKDQTLFELVDLARNFDIESPEKMTKDELMVAIIRSGIITEKNYMKKFKLFSSSADLPDRKDEIVFLTKKKLEHARSIAHIFVNSFFDIFLDQY